MTTVPLTDAQALRLRVLKFVTGGPTQPSDVSTRFQIDPSQVAAYEAQLVTWGLMTAQTTYPEPRYIMSNAGWAYVALSRFNGTALTVDAILQAIPEGTFAGDDAAIAAAVQVLINAGLVQPNTGFTLTTE